MKYLDAIGHSDTEKGWNAAKLWGGRLENSKNGWATNNGGRVVNKLGGSDPSANCALVW